MKTIFITEKPSVAQEYKKVLKVETSGKTDGYIDGFSPVLKKEVLITWAIGHLVTICTPEKHNPDWGGIWDINKLPMIPKEFKYAPLSKPYAQFKVIKSLYTRPDIECIYYAGDSAREGIYIQALIRNQIFKTAPKFEEKVVWIDSMTETAILNGIKEAKPYSFYLNMADSGYMRAISDWLIGMNFTMCFSTTSKTTINVGRVMTPTLAMVVNKQKEIDNFKKTSFYGINADDFAGWKATKGSRFFEDDRLYNEKGFKKKEDAEQLISEFNQSMALTVDAVKITPKKEYAPYLYNLADLQAACAKRFYISPDEALAYAQSLYEKKITTYPRTSSRFLSTKLAEEELKPKGFNVPPRYVNDEEIEDHHAIIPTFASEEDVAKLTGREAEIYQMILKRFTDILLPPFEYDAVSVIYRHQNGEKFYETFRKVRNYGFKSREEAAEVDNAGEEAIIDKLIPSENDVVSVSAFSLREMETKPPVPYTTGTLVLAMEKAGKLIEDEELREQIKTSGIGTSATRAEIIKKLNSKEFISVDKKQKVSPTDFGKKVIEIVSKYDEALVSPLKTADMENKLTAVANGKLTKEQYLSGIEQYIRETVEAIKSTNTERISNPSYASSEEHECPCCGRPLKFGKYGWYCSDNPTCKFTLHKEICGHKMKDADINDLIKKGHTKEYTFKSAKTGKDFRASLELDKENQTTKFKFAQKK